MHLACTKIQQSGAPYSHVYMYSLQPDGTLALEAYRGRPPVIDSINEPAGPRINAVISKGNRYIPSVSQDATHQPHSGNTESALLALIRRHDTIIGEIDIESDRPDAFDEAEQAAVVAVADALAALL
jgi:putative methionine-R-sulfoxide reductase with GAF domain